jgi:hypothetical protein
VFFFLQPSDEQVSFSEGAPMHSAGSTTASNSGGFREAVERSVSFVGGVIVDSGSEMDAVTKIQYALKSSIADWGTKIIGGNQINNYLYRYQSTCLA